jgi:alcohol dehydrogenase
MRALTLMADRKLELADLPSPAAPAAGEVQVAVKAVALNHLDLWGYRGMAFAKRKMPVVVGVEAAGEIAAVGPGTSSLRPGDSVVMYGALTCGACKACREGRDNLCENVAGIMGFHVDGFARDLVNIPARLVIPVPAGVALRDAACAPIAFATVRHMLFDNARLEPGESVLVHAGGSGIGTVAIKMAKAIGCTVITTVGDDAKAEKAKAIGADHVINYRTDRFEGAVRKLTGKKGVDVVFEHVGAETFNGSLLCLKRGGRLVTCGATSGPSTTRLVRRVHAQHPREPGQDGGRPAAGDRHRGSSRRFRARARAARKPAGVRQDHRHLLTSGRERHP